MDAARQRQFLADGYLFPIPALSSEVAEDYRRRLHRFDSSARAGAYDDLHNQVYLFNPHLLLGWVDALIHEPAILDVAGSVLGPDLPCWSAGVFQKPPHIRTPTSRGTRTPSITACRRSITWSGSG